MVAYHEQLAVPQKIPLIFGDCLQNLRSTLDYLIWELVKANKRTPGYSHQFPICRTVKQYERQMELNRLRDVPDTAIAIIDAMQPFQLPEDQVDRHMLIILDQLTNINKHRHVISTFIESRVNPASILMPRNFIETMVSEVPRSQDGSIAGHRLISYISLEDSSIKGFEIASVADTLSQFVIEQVLSRFQQFFE